MWKGRHVGLDFYDLLIEALKIQKQAERWSVYFPVGIDARASQYAYQGATLKMTPHPVPLTELGHVNWPP